MDNKPKPIELNPKFDPLRSHVEELKKQSGTDSPFVDYKYFRVATANEWLKLAKETPVPQMLFGEFWHEEEICILFSDSNLGKSILAVQIANSISKGEPIPGFRMETSKQKVLYFDFELSKKQFEVRYSVENKALRVSETPYQFDETNFKRGEINPETDIPTEDTFESFVNQSLEEAITNEKAKILIIDNITYLKNETERSKDALPLMVYLKALKSKYGLSILALAHTPKRDLSRAITQNDLGGSKMLYNFVDSCFAIGQSSTDKNIRYLKQIKARNTAIIYDTENVIVCQIDKPFNFLKFEFLNYGKERDHLKQYTENDSEGMAEKVKALNAQGRSLREIGSELGVSHMRASRILKELPKV